MTKLSSIFKSLEPKLQRVPSFKPGVGHIIAFHALPAAVNCAFLGHTYRVSQYS